MTELTEQQRQLVRSNPASPVWLMDPETQCNYALVPAATFYRWRALLSDDEFNAEEAYPLIDQVAGNEGWNDPALDIYSQLDPRNKS